MRYARFDVPLSVALSHVQRLFESTFRLDIAGAREYCEADDRWARATAFLAANGAAGWSLIEVRSRPSPQAWLAFLSGRLRPRSFKQQALDSAWFALLRPMSVDQARASAGSLVAASPAPHSYA